MSGGHSVLAPRYRPRATGDIRWRAVGVDRRRRLLFVITSLTFAAFGITLVADLPLVELFGGGPVAYALLTTLWGTRCDSRLFRRQAHSAGTCSERKFLIAGTVAMAVSLGALAAVPNLAVAYRGWHGRRGWQWDRLCGLVLTPAARNSRPSAGHGLRDGRDLRADVVHCRDDGRRRRWSGRSDPRRPTSCPAPSCCSPPPSRCDSPRHPPTRPM